MYYTRATTDHTALQVTKTDRMTLLATSTIRTGICGMHLIQKVIGWTSRRNYQLSHLNVPDQSGGNGQTKDHVRANGTATQKRSNTHSQPLDLAMAVKGMYRLLDLVNESGSNGYGKRPS